MDERELYDLADKMAKKSDDQKPTVNVFELEDPTDVQKDKADQLLRQLMLAKQRGQTSVAQKLLQEVIDLVPNYAPVQEAIGDDFVERKQFRNAKEAYHIAHRLAPLNATIENKYGEMVLKVDLRIDPATYAEADIASMASGRAATLLNVFFPGVGHIVLGRQVIGITLLVIWIGCWLIALGTPRGMEGLFGALGIKQATAPLNMMVPIAIIIAFCTWFFGLMTISSVAKRMTPKKIHMPAAIDTSDLPVRPVVQSPESNSSADPISD